MVLLFENNTVINEHEAYILGFLYADGCISNNVKGKYYSLVLTLSDKDEQILQDIGSSFGKWKIKKVVSKCQTGSFNTIRLDICDVNLIQNLIKLGVTPNKTYENNSYVFDNVPHDLKHHFVRGYFDGDGSVGIYNRKCVFSTVSVNEKLTYSILHFINSELSIETKIVKDGKYYRIRMHGNPRCIMIKELIYKDASIFMIRKKEVFDNINKIREKKSKYIGVTKSLNKWCVSIYINKNESKKYLGTYDTELECINVYNNYAKLYGKKEQEII